MAGYSGSLAIAVYDGKRSITALAWLGIMNIISLDGYLAEESTRPVPSW